jgi:DUF4097 and DUF4098 domain-containing protein YvlB
VLALGLAASAVQACDVTVGSAQYSVSEEKKFTVTGGARLSLTTWDGSIKVRGWDRNEVKVEVEKAGPDQATVDRIQVKASQEGNAITIEVTRPSPMVSAGFQRSPSASLVVTVPLQSSVTARSGDGSISVERVTGTIDLDTEDGRIVLDELTGEILARTGDGSIRGSGINGRVSLRTGDGSVDIAGVLTALAVETRDGSIEAVGRRDSRADGDWDLSTGDGSIALTLPEGFAAEVDALSGDGRVEIEQLKSLGAERGPREEGGRSKARGTLGAGGKTLRLRTGSGRIRVIEG